MVALSFQGIFRMWEKICKNNCYKLFAIILFALPQSSCFTFYVHFRSIGSTLFTQRPSSNRYEKNKFENCGTQITKLNLARHNEICSAGTLYCTQCPNFFTRSQNDLNYHVAKKHSEPKLDAIFKCKLCYQEFRGLYAICQHRNTQHGMQIESRTRKLDVEHRRGNVEDHRLRDELRSCQHFLVDSEIESARHRVFNYAVKILNRTIVNENLDHFFNKLKCAAKVNLAFGFILKKNRRWRVQRLLRIQKQNPAGLIQTCVHP